NFGKPNDKSPGIVSIALTGSGSFDGKVSIALKDATPDADEELSGSPFTRITLQELIDGLSDIGTIVGTPTITGTAMKGSPLLTFNTLSRTIARSAGSWTTAASNNANPIQLLRSSPTHRTHTIP